MSDLDFGILEETLFEPSEIENLPKLVDLRKSHGELTEKLRQELRRMSFDSLYFFCKVILGYSKLNPRVHLPMCLFCDQTREYKRREMLMPRTHYKTTIWTISDSILLICKNPNIQILMIADTQTNASRFMQEIQQHFQYNEVFRWVFSELIPDNFAKVKWSNTEMVVKRTIVSGTPTIDAIGALGGSESRHYDYIKADDLVTEKCIRSDVEMDKIIKWAGGLESLLKSQVDDWIDFVGSRKKKGDLYEVQEKMYSMGMEQVEIGPYAYAIGEMAVFIRGAIENNEVIFPENVSLRFLMRLRQYDPERYHAQYANSPKGTGLNTFDIESLRYYKWDGDGNILFVHEGEVIHKASPWGMERMLLFDPSVAEKKSSSQQAILVVAKGSHPFRVVLEAFIGHILPDEAIQIFLDMDKKWHPSIASVEKRGFQGWVKYGLYEICELKGIPYPPIVEWPLEGASNAIWAKVEHIRAMQPMIRANYLWVHEAQTELIDQIEFYPNVRWDDGLDALAQAMDYWPMAFDEADVATRREAEDRYIQKQVLGGAFLPPRKAWDEEAFLSQFNATGYRMKGGVSA